MKIYQAICDIMKEIGPIEKDRKNQQQGFSYRGIDDVMNALQPLLVKYKVFVVPEVLEHNREERTNKNGTTLLYSICTMKYTFFTDDGSSVSAIVVGEGMDSGDKATNKAMAIAMKYACFQVFCIPTEEMQDPDAETHQVKSKSDAKKPAKQDNPSETNVAVITDAQRTRLFKIAKDKGIDVDMLKKIVENYGYSRTDDIKVSDYEKICKEVES